MSLGSVHNLSEPPAKVVGVFENLTAEKGGLQKNIRKGGLRKFQCKVQAMKIQIRFICIYIYIYHIRMHQAYLIISRGSLKILIPRKGIFKNFDKKNEIFEDPPPLLQGGSQIMSDSLDQGNSLQW